MSQRVGICLTGPYDGRMLAVERSNWVVAEIPKLNLMPSVETSKPYPDDLLSYRTFEYIHIKIGVHAFWVPEGWRANDVIDHLLRSYEGSHAQNA